MAKGACGVTGPRPSLFEYFPPKNMDDLTNGNHPGKIREPSAFPS